MRWSTVSPIGPISKAAQRSFAMFGLSLPLLAFILYLGKGRIFKVTNSSSALGFLFWFTIFLALFYQLLVQYIGQAMRGARAACLLRVGKSVRDLALEVVLVVTGFWIYFFAAVVPEQWEEIAKAVEPIAANWESFETGQKFALISIGIYFSLPLLAFLAGIPGAVRVFSRAMKERITECRTLIARSAKR